MSLTILVTAANLARAGVDLLDQAGARVLYLSGSSNGAAAEIERIMASEPVDAVISRTETLSGRAIESCPTLKVISKHGVGVSNIDVDAATGRGIPVYVTPGANAQSVAEMTLGLMFAAARRISWMDAEVHAGRWSRAQDGVELSGKSLGLVGFGQIGRRVAAVARAIGMTVRAFDPALSAEASAQVSAELGVQVVGSLAALLPVSDVLSLHVPLNAHTRNMLGAAQFAAMPRGAILINTARGEVVDEAALIAALQSGQLRAAGLDTMAVEPLPADSPLIEVPNLVMTPHVGGSTPAALAGMAAGAASNILGFLRGSPPDRASCVNPQALEKTAT